GPRGASCPVWARALTVVTTTARKAISVRIVCLQSLSAWRRRSRLRPPGAWWSSACASLPNPRDFPGMLPGCHRLSVGAVYDYSNEPGMDMTTKRGLFLAGAMLCTLTAPAGAADMLLKAPPMRPVFNWTGYYIGASGGYAWGDSNVATAVGAIGTPI